MSFYPCMNSNKPLDVSGTDIHNITNFESFHGKAFIQTVNSKTTINLSIYSGYDKLIVDNFFCIIAGGTCNGRTDKVYTNGAYIYTSGRFTQAGIAYDSSTGILTITPAYLYSSGSYEKGTATASVYLPTSIYLIK